MNNIGDEFHYLFECTFFENERKALLPFGFSYTIFIINLVIFLGIKNLLYQKIINTMSVNNFHINIWKYHILDMDTLIWKRKATYVIESKLFLTSYH